MTSSYGKAQPEQGKMGQMIPEFFAKCLQIILESRSPYLSSRNYSGEQMISSPSSSSSPSPSCRPRDRGFNLALRDCPAALENTVSRGRNNLEPFVVDVILVQRPSYWHPVSSPGKGFVRNFSWKEQLPNPGNLERDEFQYAEKTEKIIERWVVQYETQKSVRGSGRKRSSGTSFHTSLKKSILLLRSLYTMVRLLPAYKLFHKLNSSDQIFSCNLDHRVESFVEPFTREDELEMQHFEFSPVETFCGRLCLSVIYRSSLSDVICEPLMHMTPQFIPDYVGSPMVDPLKRILPNPLPQGYPSSFSLGRRHSWSCDLYRVSPPSLLPSPSPTFSDTHSTISKPSLHCLSPTSFPHHLPEVPRLSKYHTNFDANWPVPNFSPFPSLSPSPSPPSFQRSHVSKALLQAESAPVTPVTIPAPKLFGASLVNSNQNLSPSPPFKGTKTGASKIQRSSGVIPASSTVNKLFRFGKNETGRYLGVNRESNSSPPKTFSKSSSRLSVQDDFDDSDFSGPFLVDDDDDPIYTVAGSRPGSGDSRGSLSHPLEPGEFSQLKKSQDIGLVIHMLQKAPPLRQDMYNSINLSETSKPATLRDNIKEKNTTFEDPAAQPDASFILSSSGQVLRRTTADALEELEGYREMKDLLLRQDKRSHT